MCTGAPGHSSNDDAIRRDFPRNAAVMVAWDGLWALGMCFCMFATVVPGYLLYIGAPRWLMQAVMSLFGLLTVLQLAAGRLARRPNRHAWATALWLSYGGVWVVYGAVAVWGHGRLPDGLWVPLFVGLVVVLSVTNHLGAPVTIELVLENTPIEWRGRLVAWRSVSLGVCGLAGTIAAQALMASRPLPANFHVAFVVGGLLYVGSCLPFLICFRDRAQTALTERPQARRLRQAVMLLAGDRGFRAFLAALLFVRMAQCLAPMLIACGKDVLAMREADLARFSMMWFVAAVVSGPLIPPLADRHGFRVVGTLVGALLAVAYLLPLVLGASQTALLLAYGCAAATMALGYTVLANLGSEIAPAVSPALIVAVGSTVLMPVDFIVGTLAGLWVDVRHAAAYPGVFAVGLATATTAVFVYLRFVREPRGAP